MAKPFMDVELHTRDLTKPRIFPDASTGNQGVLTLNRARVPRKNNGCKMRDQSAACSLSCHR
jgi:hypothetical protein